MECGCKLFVACHLSCASHLSMAQSLEDGVQRLFGSSLNHLWFLGLLQSERCLTFQSSCVNYILNIALAYRIEGDKFRVQGWINLGAGETSEVKSPTLIALLKCI